MRDFTTVRYDGRTSGIVTDVKVTQSRELCKKLCLPYFEKKVKALWDTGAVKSGISKSLTAKLGLLEIKNGKYDDSLEIKKGIGGAYESYSYCIDILITGSLWVTNIEATNFEDNDNFDILIGMDIITKGDLAITQDNGKTVFSFTIPSLNKPIDFEKELRNHLK